MTQPRYIMGGQGGSFTASSGGGAPAWAAGTYASGSIVTRAGYLWRANASTSEDPMLVEGNLGSGADWVVNTAGSPGMVQSGTELLMINNGLGSSVVAFRQSVNSGFLGKMLVVDLGVSGTADGITFGLYDSSLAQTPTNPLSGVTGFYGTSIDIYDPLTSQIHAILNGADSAQVSYTNANAVTAGSGYSRWYFKMIQNGSNWNLEMLRDARAGVLSPYTGYDNDQIDDLIPIAQFTNLARPSYTNWRFMVGANTGGATGVFKIRGAWVRNIISGNWTAIARLPTQLG